MSCKKKVFSSESALIELFVIGFNTFSTRKERKEKCSVRSVPCCAIDAFYGGGLATKTHNFPPISPERIIGYKEWEGWGSF